jgi:hypothetical protein
MSSNLQTILYNRIGGVIVSVVASSTTEPRSGQSKDYNIGSCCLSGNYAALSRKNKDWFARNQDNVSKWGDMSVRGRLFQ